MTTTAKVEALEAMAAFLPELDRLEDDAVVGRLRNALDEHGIVMLGFDWMAWREGAQRFATTEAIATATLDEVQRLVTLHVRQDRFVEGHFANEVQRGTFGALLRRMAVLAAQRRAVAMRVVRGDITTLAIDAIVNAANSALGGGGGVDGAIHRAAGPGLMEACRAVAPCPTGQARITPGFALPARWIIHAVGPMWRGGDDGEPAQLASAYRASLALALAHGCKAVAFPAISCGIYGYPLAAACTLAVETIGAWCLANPGLVEVVLVAFDERTAAAMARALE